MKPLHYTLLTLLLGFAGSVIAFQPPVPTTTVQDEEVTKQKSTSGAYKGDPINVDVTNQPIADLLRFVADEAKFNLYIDPSAEGITVTYKFEQMPWDQLLDIVLSNAGLAYTINGGSLRVASEDVIREELQNKIDIMELKERSEPLELLSVNLVHADAHDVSRVLQSFLTSRGRVQIDRRTNMIVVQDTPTKLAQLKEVIAKLDKELVRKELQGSEL